MTDLQYAVYFEAKNLPEDDVKRITQYFQIRRRSGGGECEVEKIGGDTYRIAFRHKADQERVLSRKDHVINLQSGAVSILLRGQESKDEDNPSQLTLSDQQGASGGKPMEKVFKLDPYLLQFLKDSPSAALDLKKHLSSLSTSFKVDVLSEKIVVMREAVQDEVLQEKWEAKVEKVFWELQDRYIIRFVVEHERIMILKQNPYLSMKDLNLGIYNEGNITVIVGEFKEMERFFKVLDDLSKKPTSQECPVSQKRYALVKDCFEQEIKSHFTEVKITEERSDTVVLKGPEDKVQMARTKLQELMNQIQEKKIPLPQALTAFLLSSGAVQKFQVRFQQSLRSPVLIDTRGPDLVLLSLSSGALEEAATAIQRDLSLETVTLETSTEIDTLKDELRKALQQANHSAINVDLTFVPGTNVDPRMSVQLVGYSPDVCKLRKIIQDYKVNHMNYRDSLQLVLPEMVDRFSDLLALVGVKTTNVSVVATHSPSPCVQISGPRCRVKDLKDKLDSAFGCLIWDIMELDGPGVLKFFQGDGFNTLALVQNSFQVMIVPKNNAQVSTAAARNTAGSSLPNLTVFSSQVIPADPSLALEIVFRGIEEQKVDVLVAPMLKSALDATKVGMSLLDKGGQQLKSNFNAAKGKRKLSPGDVLEVDGTPLGCSKVFFIECVPWNGSTDDSEKALRSGLERVLALCVQQRWKSVVLPVIGPGPALSVPIRDASNILTKAIGIFGRTGITGLLSIVQIAIMPNYSNAEEIFHTVFTGLSTQMVDHMGQAVFQSLSSEIDEITITVGGCKLQLVFGDISNETTDAIVNTTDFADFQTEVCNDILTVAGPQVQAALTGARVNKGEIYTTQPGNFPCSVIMHVCGEKNADVIKGLARDIVSKCERDGYKSVAIPAICAGKGGLEARLIAQSILQGVKDAITGTNFTHIKTVRIVLRKITVFLEFKAVAQQVFGTFTQMTAPAPLIPSIAIARGHRSSSSSTNLSSLVQSLPVQHTDKSEFLVLGLTAESVAEAAIELRRLYEKECSSWIFSEEELRHFGQEEIEQITKNLDSLGIQITQQGRNRLVVRGLTNGVNEITRMMQEALLRQVRGRDQDRIFAKVSWCILGSRGDWERLPKKAHHQLENNDVSEGVLDAQRQKWNVNLTTMEVTSAGVLQQVSKLKRLENLSDFSIPFYWDNMVPGEALKVVPLLVTSAEYRRVKADFKRTVQKTVLKIERIQNVHLRRAFEVRKKELEDRNGLPVGAGKRVLYHGTTADACSSIQKTNFDRRFAGQNATRFGIGTYFAVDASYSANEIYSVPAADGTQLMFVALVLTGHYTQGQSDMKTPPARSTQDPSVRFDSVVDNVQNPSMFVVFHDCQAYPDYLITFK